MALPADFSKIYGSTATGGLTPISDVNYAKGWEFVGSNPPTKNDFSYLQNLSDLKSQWLYSNKLQRTDPFGDIKSDGATVLETARSNLGLGTAALRTVGTGTNNVPDMSGFASGTGWSRLPNGKILQWGSYSNPGSVATGTITFPIPFVSTPGRVLMTSFHTTSDSNSIVLVQDTSSLSLTSFAWRLITSGPARSFNWWSIGE